MRFDDVDASGDGERHAQVLATLARTLAPMRRGTLARLGIGPGIALLDAGCGAGDLAVEVAHQVRPGGRVVGVDTSRDLLGRARAAARLASVEPEFLLADITDLPFADGEFDVVRSERVLQHLEPAAAPTAARELLRVVKPGGLVQVLDPDHLQTAIDATDRELTRLIVERFASYARNPESGLRLAGLIRSAGGTGVEIDIWPLTITRLAAFQATHDVARELDGLVTSGELEPARAAAYLADLEARDRAGAFLATIISYAVTAVKA